MTIPTMLYSGLHPLLRIFVVGTAAYFFLLLSLRTSAPRILAKTNVFDFIVAVGVGSAFGRILTAKEVALSEACFTFALLTTLQYTVSKMRWRFKWFARITDAKPVLLFADGAFVGDAMRRARLTKFDLQESLRMHGVSTFDEISSVVLEASGDISMIRKAPLPMLDRAAPLGSKSIA